jgi:hypothetical protein
MAMTSLSLYATSAVASLASQIQNSSLLIAANHLKLLGLGWQDIV